MRIVIDLQALNTGSRFRGIGRYLMGLTEELLRQGKKNEFILVINSLNGGDVLAELVTSFKGLIDEKNIRIITSPITDNLCYWNDNSFEEKKKISQKIYSYFINSLNPDVFLCGSNFEFVGDYIYGTDFKCIKSIIHYDLVPYMNSDKMRWNKQVRHLYLERFKALSDNDYIFCISNYVKKELLEHTKCSEEKTIAILTDVNKQFKNNETACADKDVISNMGITKPFVLYAGGFDERKNVERLVEAYGKLSKTVRQQYQLVIVCGKITGAQNLASDYIQQAGVSNEETVVLGYVTDEQLIALYKKCYLFVFPSLYEGFGLTALEAMNCGAAVIGSNTTAVREVIAWEEAMFDPCDVNDITDKIKKALVDSTFRDALIENGNKQKERFSWEKSAGVCLKIWERAFEQRPEQNEQPTIKQPESLIEGLKKILTENDNIVQIAKNIDVNFQPKKSKQQLLVDISELIQRDSATGIQRVVRAIINELLHFDLQQFDVRLVYATNYKTGYFYANNYSKKKLNIQLDSSDSDEPISYYQGDAFLGLDLQSVIVPKQRELLKLMYNSGVKIYFVIYDLIPIIFPVMCDVGVYDAHLNWLNTISEFGGVTCISAAVAEEFREWAVNNVKLKPWFKINYFHLGADINNSLPSKGLPKDAKDVLRIMGERVTILVVSTIEPRKKQDQIFHAVELLWHQGIDMNLVLVGKQGWKMDKLAKEIENSQEYGKRLFWLRGISDEYLEKVYEKASVLVMASLAEGFGLSIVEGAKYKKPLILRDIPVFKEIAGENAFYFYGIKPENLADSIKKWLELYRTGQIPDSSQIKPLTWHKSTEMLLESLNIL